MGNIILCQPLSTAEVRFMGSCPHCGSCEGGSRCRCLPREEYHGNKRHNFLLLGPPCILYLQSLDNISHPSYKQEIEDRASLWPRIIAKRRCTDNWCTAWFCVNMTQVRVIERKEALWRSTSIRPSCKAFSLISDQFSEELGVVPSLVALDSIRQQAEQARRSKPVSSPPPWALC